MRVISAAGDGAESIIGRIAEGLSAARLPYLSVSRGQLVYSSGGRHVDGYAIDGDGDFRGSIGHMLLASADLVPFFEGFDEAVIILCSGVGAGEEAALREFNGRAYVIASSETQIPPGLKRFPLISCGMGGKDTVTFSSIKAEEGIVCLQRQLHTFGGGIAEPQEYLLEPCGTEAFPALAAFAAMLICDLIR